MSDPLKIDLGEFSSEQSIVLSGRPKGVNVRKKLELDTHDAATGELLVSIPERIISLNSSFFLGLFSPSVKILGVEGFEKKYKFKCREELLEDIERGKREALNEANALKSKTQP